MARYLNGDFHEDEIIKYFPVQSRYLMNWSDEINVLFREYLSKFTQFSVVDVLPHIQFCSKYFGLKINLESPRVLKKEKKPILRSSYEDFLSYFKLNSSALDIVRANSNISTT